MKRDLSQLRHFADAIAADLLRTAPGQLWSCRVDDEFVLVLRHGSSQAAVPIDREVDPWGVPLDARSDEMREWEARNDPLSFGVGADGEPRILVDPGITEPIAANVDPMVIEDASQAVGDAVGVALRRLRVVWPVCVEHGKTLSVCSATWVCAERHDLDLGLVGKLAAAVVRVGRHPNE